MIYEVKDVVCDYGVFENEKLIYILNNKENALLIKDILKSDLRKQKYINSNIKHRMEIDIFVDKAIKNNHIIANPLEDYSSEEIKKLSILAKKNDLLLTIKNETSNVYKGIVINLVKKTSVKNHNIFIDHL